MGAIRKTVAMFLVLLAVVIAGVAIAGEETAPPKPEDGAPPAEAQPPAEATPAQPDQAQPGQQPPAKLRTPVITLKTTSLAVLGVSSPEDITYFAASPDARRYAVRCAGQLIIDGKEAATYAPDSRPIFSPDSQHYAYSGTSPQSSYCVLDGEVTPTDGVVERLFYSPDSKRLAYILRGADNKCCLVIDGEKGKMYDDIKPYSAWQPRMGPTMGTTSEGCNFFSPDSKRVAYLAQSEGKSIMVLDGNECAESAPIANYEGARALFSEGARALFSPDSKHFVYYTPGSPGGGDIPILDGVRIEHAFGVCFSADGAHVAYCLRNEEKNTNCVVKDGEPGTEYKSITPPIFSPDSQHLAYLAETPQGFMLVVDGAEKPFLGERKMASFLYSPDSAHLAYTANNAIVLDGAERQFAFRPRNLVFSPDSNHLAATINYHPPSDGPGWDTRKKTMMSVLLDFLQQTEYDQIGNQIWKETYDKFPVLVFGPDSKRLVYFGNIKNDWFIVVNGREFIIDAVPYTPPVFDSPTKFHFLALKNGNEMVLFEAEITE